MLSEFPEIALKYGYALLVCRVMVGRPYRDQEKGVPDGFNSKIVAERLGQKVGIIIVDKEEQILPASIIRGARLRSF